AHGEVLFGRHAGHVAVADDGAVLAQHEVQRVAPVEHAEHGLQQVVAVLAATDHVQEQVEFGWRGAAEQSRQSRTVHLSTTMRRRASPHCASTRRGAACGESSAYSAYSMIQPLS